MAWTALASAAGTLARPSSRAKNATVSDSGSTPLSAVATCSASASFQRSTPSAITNRRPIANVIADSAPVTASGVQRSASSSEEHTSELQSPDHLVCRLLLEKKNNTIPATNQSNTKKTLPRRKNRQ